jgi:DNA-binding PadR family transcriptional regulator
MHGYEMIQELEARTSGVWRPSPGSVYPTLQLLEDEGLVTSGHADGKRLYSLTDEGQAEAERLSGPRTPWQQVTEGVDPSTMNLREVFGGLFMAAKQVFEAGSDEQKARAVELLTETRRGLYAILAEDPAAS